MNPLEFMRRFTIPVCVAVVVRVSYRQRKAAAVICSDCEKYVICNADEGEPGTFKDRIIMETDPHTLIEGLVIAAYSIGAHRGFVYIRGEYELSIQRVQNAIEQAYGRGFLGKNILGSGFDFDLEVRRGAGSYLCGEELTLIESVEGKRGYPRIKPLPCREGALGAPTLINNVETLANFQAIILNGKSGTVPLEPKIRPAQNFYH